MNTHPRTRTCHAAPLFLLPLLALLGCGGDTEDPGPGREGPTDAALELPHAASFDGEKRLVYDPDPESPRFNFYSSGTVDLMIWPASEPGSDPDSAVSQCLLSCADSEEQTRYGIYLLENLEGIGIWNGEELQRFEIAIVPDTWLHVAVVFDRDWVTVALDGVPIGVERLSIGRPVDPSDPEGRQLTFCKTYVGNTANGKNGFLGRIAWVRSWLAPIGVGDLTLLPTFAGIPPDPVLAQCFGACSEFRKSSFDLRVSSDKIRWEQSELAKGAKLEAPLTKAIPWVYDLETAKQRAQSDGKQILAWSTRSDAYDAACLALEQDVIPADEIVSLVGEKFVPLLLVATTRSPAPLGIRAGHGAILDSEGKILRSFELWSRRFLEALLRRIEAASNIGEDRAREFAELLLEPSATLTASELARIRFLSDSVSLSDALRIRRDQIQGVQELRDLQRRFRRKQRIGFQGEATQAFEEAAWIYELEALRLFAELPLPLEPQSALADYAVLLWRGLIADPRPELIADVASFVTPMRLLAPAVDAVVAAMPLPDLSGEAAQPQGKDGGK